MDITLHDEEVRILGCLLEKKMATPDYYPLSLNALVNACNQKVNRDPVVNYDETTVLRAIDSLKQHKLVWQNNQGRVPKYKEGLVEEYNLSDEEAAVLCELMLRGPQTVGELRVRTERMHPFENLEDVNTVLENLIGLQYVLMLPRQPGHKEVRYCQLFGGPPQTSDSQTASTSIVAVDQERLILLEEKVAALSLELQELKQAFVDFRRQFE